MVASPCLGHSSISAWLALAHFSGLSLHQFLREITKPNLLLRTFIAFFVVLSSTLTYVGVVNYYSNNSHFLPLSPTIDYKFYKIKNEVYIFFFISMFLVLCNILGA